MSKKTKKHKLNPGIRFDLGMKVPKHFTDRARPWLRPYVYSLCAWGDARMIDPIGSCTFINYRHRDFLVTAAHVWKDVQKSYSQVPIVFNQVGPAAEGGESCFIDIPGDVILSSDAKQREPRIDLAVIPLEEHFISKNGFAAVPERMLGSARNDEDLHRFIHGFPARDNPKYLTGRNAKHYPRGIHFFEEKPIGFDWGRFPMYTPVDNLVTPYQLQKHVSNPGKSKKSRVKSPDPKGLSGGALWSTPSIYFDPSELRLIGITISQERRNQRERITFATKIGRVCELIDDGIFGGPREVA